MGTSWSAFVCILLQSQEEPRLWEEAGVLYRKFKHSLRQGALLSKPPPCPVSVSWLSPCSPHDLNLPLYPLHPHNPCLPAFTPQQPRPLAATSPTKAPLSFSSKRPSLLAYPLSAHPNDLVWTHLSSLLWSAPTQRQWRALTGCTSIVGGCCPSDRFCPMEGSSWGWQGWLPQPSMSLACSSHINNYRSLLWRTQLGHQSHFSKNLPQWPEKRGNGHVQWEAGPVEALKTGLHSPFSFPFFLEAAVSYCLTGWQTCCSVLLLRPNADRKHKLFTKDRQPMSDLWGKNASDCHQQSSLGCWLLAPTARRPREGEAFPWTSNRLVCPT